MSESLLPSPSTSATDTGWQVVRCLIVNSFFIHREFMMEVQFGWLRTAGWAFNIGLHHYSYQYGNVLRFEIINIWILTRWSCSKNYIIVDSCFPIYRRERILLPRSPDVIFRSEGGGGNQNYMNGAQWFIIFICGFLGKRDYLQPNDRPLVRMLLPSYGKNVILSKLVPKQSW